MPAPGSAAPSRPSERRSRQGSLSGADGTGARSGGVRTRRRYKDALISDPVFLMNALAARISGPHADSVKPEAVAAYAEAILAAKSGPHAEILAWYAYNSGQFPAARAWFDKAFAWEPSEARLKGLALSEGQLGDRAALVALYKAYGKTYPTIWDDVHLAKKGARRAAARPVIDRMQVARSRRSLRRANPISSRRLPDARTPCERSRGAAPCRGCERLRRAAGTETLWRLRRGDRIA